VATVGALVDWLRRRGPAWESAFGEGRKTIRCAVNQEFVADANPLRPGDEVAFFPPVTGG
jgi:molybdopterin synthase sulfur carrier subunit